MVIEIGDIVRGVVAAIYSHKNVITAWVVLGLSFIAANLPFLFERKLFVRKTAREKSLGWRFLELVLLYFLVGGVASLLEKNANGSVYPQGWAFYVATFCLFLVFAFPGFVYCRLWRRVTRKQV